ncbi:hypothetical protein ACJIZ3_000096 [Penstemon smallii]|uniref:Uncharacterized protein n=1 Tax=Penstemon smallii TaxID=265156 RepID=A0ABD3RAM9_9LAMI
MAGKRKHTGKTMMDVVAEASSTSASSATRSLSRQSEAQSCSRSGSLSGPPHPDASSGSSDPSSQDKQMGRGRSKMTSLWESGAKLQLVLTDDGRIDGPHRVQFKTQLGVMARNASRFPLTKTSFKEIDPHVIDAFWKEIKENTTLSDEARKVVVEDLAAKWKQGKYKLKKKSFKAFKDDTKRMKVLLDHCVPKAESEAMLKYWNLEEVR